MHPYTFTIHGTDCRQKEAWSAILFAGRSTIHVGPIGEETMKGSRKSLCRESVQVVLSERRVDTQGRTPRRQQFFHLRFVSVTHFGGSPHFLTTIAEIFESFHFSFTSRAKWGHTNCRFKSPNQWPIFCTDSSLGACFLPVRRRRDHAERVLSRDLVYTRTSQKHFFRM